MRKKYVVGNWKMNMTVAESQQFFTRLDKEITTHRDVEVVVCPTSLAIQPLAEKIDTKKFKLGAQNFHYADHGTYTGEISAAMVKDFVDYGIVGHSDRRSKFHEHDDEIARKMAAAIRNGITPILCVGENLIQRQEGHSDLVVRDQVISDLAMLTAEDISQILIAYEPIWAISSGDGQGESAKPEPVKKIIDTIRKTVRELYGKKAEESLHVLYGGSSNPDNVVSYMKITGVDGVLVGGASLNYKQFASMIDKAHNL